jgi:hypothetical protein
MDHIVVAVISSTWSGRCRCSQSCCCNVLLLSPMTTTLPWWLTSHIQPTPCSSGVIVLGLIQFQLVFFIDIRRPCRLQSRTADVYYPPAPEYQYAHEIRYKPDDDFCNLSRNSVTYHALTVVFWVIINSSTRMQNPILLEVMFSMTWTISLWIDSPLSFY